MSSNTDCILCGEEIGSRQVNLDMNPTIHPLLCRNCLPLGKIAVINMSEGVLITDWGTYDKVRTDLIKDCNVGREWLPSAPCNREVHIMFPDHFLLLVVVFQNKYLDEPEFRKTMDRIKELIYYIEESRSEVDDMEWEIDTEEDEDERSNLEKELEEMEEELEILKKRIEDYPVQKILR